MKQESLSVGQRVKLNRGISPGGVAMSPGTKVKVTRLTRKGFYATYKGRDVYIGAHEVDPV